MRHHQDRPMTGVAHPGHRDETVAVKIYTIYKRVNRSTNYGDEPIIKWGDPPVTRGYSL